MNFTQYIIMTRTLFIIIWSEEQRAIHFYEKSADRDSTRAIK